MKRAALLTTVAGAGVPCNTASAGDALTIEKLRAGARAIEERDARLRASQVWIDEAAELDVDALERFANSTGIVSGPIGGTMSDAGDWPIEEIPW